MNSISFSGTYTALVTPFNEDQSVDYESFRQLITYQIDAGVQGLVVLGSTGEAASLSIEEKEEIIHFLVKEVGGRLPVVVGVGSNNLQVTLGNMQTAESLGADGFLIVAPYYSKPTQPGLKEYFSQVAASTTKPIVLYSHPGRCGVDIGVETVAFLHDRYPHVCALKEAGGSCDKVSLLRQRLDESFTLISGDDSITLPFMSLGAKGVISVVSNALPEAFSLLVQKALANDFKGAEALYKDLYLLLNDLSCLSSNPVPIKQLLSMMGVIKSNTVRLPLCPMDAVAVSSLDKQLQYLHETGLIKQVPQYA